jgi:hypothetical protein
VAQAEEPEAPEPVADQVEEPNVNVVEEAGTDQPEDPQPVETIASHTEEPRE